MSRQGLRCKICTGCGLCPGVQPGDRTAGKLHILTGEQPAVGGEVSLHSWLAAVDIGTTTIAMLLYDHRGRVVERYVALNPQAVYGADVISRIKASETASCRASMQRMVREVVESGLRRFQKCLPEGNLLRCIIAANTVMTYLFMGWDVKELGHAPFTASRLEFAVTEISGISCLLLPGISAFVGGDIVAGIYASNMWRQEEITLLIDLGTNGELVLGNRQRRISCSTAAGPAFEGGVNRGVWGADMVHLTAALYREGILDETGLLQEPYFREGIRVGNVTVTQEAIRCIQLAKAAIAVGIETLLEHYGISCGQVDRVVLAGGFGYYLVPEDASVIGLLPATLGERAEAGGNMALKGVRSIWEQLETEGEDSGRSRIRKIAVETESLTLAAENSFGSAYMKHLSF